MKSRTMSKYLILFIAIYLTACQEKASLSDAYGNFEANPTTVSSEVSGQLLFFDISEGLKIEKGRYVGLVDTTLLDLQRKQIQASINTFPKKLRNTLADIEVLNKKKENISRERDRVLNLVNKKAATSKQLDDLNGELQLVDKQIDALNSQTSISNRAILSEKEPLLAQINVIKEKINRSYIHNPVSGTVLLKIAEEKEIVGPGTPLYRIGNLDTISLRFYVDAIQLQDVSLGDAIEVLTDKGEAGWNEHTGIINWIAEEAEFTPKTIQTKEDRVNLVYALKAKVPNPKGILKIGMPAEVNFNSSDKSTEKAE
jgi:HlyD family secretion protein